MKNYNHFPRCIRLWLKGQAPAGGKQGLDKSASEGGTASNFYVQIRRREPDHESKAGKGFDTDDTDSPDWNHRRKHCRDFTPPYGGSKAEPGAQIGTTGLFPFQEVFPQAGFQPAESSVTGFNMSPKTRPPVTLRLFSDQLEPMMLIASVRFFERSIQRNRAEIQTVNLPFRDLVLKKRSGNVKKWIGRRIKAGRSGGLHR
jgi:hypothetical protein